MVNNLISWNSQKLVSIFENVFIVFVTIKKHKFLDEEIDSGNQESLEVTDEKNNAFVGKCINLLYELN